MTYGAPSFWTDEKVEILTELWAEGQTAQYIAKMVGAVSRSAVIGKVHRLGLVQGSATPDAIRLRNVASARGAERRREAARRRGNREAVMHEKKLHKAVVKTGPKPPTVLPPLPILDAPVTPHYGAPDAICALTDRQCRFPIGHPSDADFRFCSNSRGLVTSYCPDHMAIAYQPRQERKQSQRNYGLPASGMRHRGGELA